jgi:hypothetical protein
LSANTLADTVERLFDVDYDIEAQYNGLLNGTSKIDYQFVFDLWLMSFQVNGISESLYAIIIISVGLSDMNPLASWTRPVSSSSPILLAYLT